eukprot:TRINITY_DN6155_c0_g1_i1.p1 TRINITY_DN6155_c0_g1~~TRINITY_DN6155_c0_g1_i1.p1  ORF type:complete len:231 (+),score=60.61 TRINITY_DN6155_c0_g1_i1:99-695(+)
MCSAGIAVYSFFQIGSQEEAADVSIDCDASPFSSNRPLLIYVGSKSDGEYVQCPWNGINSWSRICANVIMMLVPVVPLYFGFYRKKRWVVWATGTMCAVFMVGCFALMVMDANDVRVSSSWCSKGAKSSGIPESDLKCDYWPFITMCLVESVPIVFWGVMTVLVFFYANTYMEDDFTDWDLDYQDAEHEGLLDKYSAH